MLEKFTTKRFLFSVAGFVASIVLCWNGKMTGGDFVFAMAVVIAGHHAEDCIKAYKSTT